MVSIASGGLYTHTMVNGAGRTISSTFTNQTNELVEVSTENFTFAEGENFIVSTNPALRRIQAATAYVGITYKDLTLFGVPATVAGSVATEMGKQRAEKQKELYGS